MYVGGALRAACILKNFGWMYRSKDLRTRTHLLALRTFYEEKCEALSNCVLGNIYFNPCLLTSKYKGNVWCNGMKSLYAVFDTIDLEEDDLTETDPNLDIEEGYDLI